MIRILITADRCEELRTFLKQMSDDEIFQHPPKTFRDIKDIPRPDGCYMPRHAKTGAFDGRPR